MGAAWAAQLCGRSLGGMGALTSLGAIGAVPQISPTHRLLEARLDRIACSLRQPMVHEGVRHLMGQNVPPRVPGVRVQGQ